ncbi:hypothetical protein EMPS_09473 [Entomortierella parvispora]|uniref:Myb-like domain-containing protein n=1 Tax=Entomortierella parvispora TaxID=205924 RepID=A0A9P3HI18_9FUNG|nr:hypothetical protein EMPS_09473 [Entomortierella parvispora]
MLHHAVSKPGTTDAWTVLSRFARFSSTGTATAKSGRNGVQKLSGKAGRKEGKQSVSARSPPSGSSDVKGPKLIPRPDTKKPAKETPQLRQLRKDLGHPPRQATAEELAAAAARYLGSSSKIVWNQAMDEELLQLYRDRIAWRDIDLEMGLPYSASHHRFHTVLDPNLKSWLLPNGQQNEEMLQYLIYLKDQKKIQFSDIAKLELMREPWPIPDPSLETKPFEQKKPTEGKPDTFLPIHRVAIVQKYAAYKSFLNRTKNQDRHNSLLEAIHRGVEIHGENWTRVAKYADSLMKYWSGRELRRSKKDQHGGVTSEATTPVETEPSTAEALYKGSLKHGTRWGLEDDLIMTRRVIDLARRISITGRITLPSDRSPVDERLSQPLERLAIWEDIALALGNHTPQQCQRRWSDLINMEDGDKSAQTTSWHRFERFQFWMVWTYLMKDQKQGQQLLKMMKTSRRDKMRNTTIIAEMCRDLSLGKEISRWLRHRSKVDCERYFITAVNHTLELNIPLEAVKGQQTKDIYRATTLRTPNELLRLIEESVAKPLLAKMTTISESVLNDPHQNIVRPNWTQSKLQTLQELVLQQKEGVFRANSEVDWSRISRELKMQSQGEEEDPLPPALTKLAKPTIKANPEPSDLPSDVVLSVPRHFTAEQCRSCWEFLAAQPGRIRMQSGRRLADTYYGKDALPNGQEDDGWTDMEVMLLKQGVRRYGNNWADVRAQYLPARNVSDLHQKWRKLSISAPATSASSRTSSSSIGSTNTAVAAAGEKVDRLSDPDYVGLLSALDKISDGKDKESS